MRCVRGLDDPRDGHDPLIGHTAHLPGTRRRADPGSESTRPRKLQADEDQPLSQSDSACSTWNGSPPVALGRCAEGSACVARLARMATSEVSAQDQQRLARFASLVAQSPHNLVSRRARDELLTRHVPECVALARALPTGPLRVLDIGSGGGFPGLVIALVRPDLTVHLLDSTKKKTAFLEDAATTLDLAVTVHTGRAEELARSSLGGTFDVVTARALAPIERLVPLAMPFLRVGGLLYAVKGERWQAEVDAAPDAIRRSGARIVATPDEVDVAPHDGVAPTVVMLARDR